MSEGPTAGDILLGLFLIAAGLCLTLVGGGCTLILLGELRNVMNGGGGGLFFLLLAVAALAAGLALLWFGFKIMSGKYRN